MCCLLLPPNGAFLRRKRQVWWRKRRNVAPLQDGVVLVWRSADPLLQVQEVRGALAGRTFVHISAGKVCSPKASDGVMWTTFECRHNCA